MLSLLDIKANFCTKLKPNIAVTPCRCNNFITGARKVCLNGLKKCLALLALTQCEAVIADKSGCDTAFFPRIDDDLRSQMFLFLPEAFIYSSSFTLLIQMWRKKCISTQKLISFRWLPLCTRCPFLRISFTSIPQHWNDSLRSEWFCLLFPHRLLVMSL